LMWKYDLLLTDASDDDIATRKKQVASGALHPRAVKADLARRIVTDFHGAEEAARAAEKFDARARGDATGDEPVVEWTIADETRTMRQLLIELKLAASGREADQKLDQGAVSVDGRKVAGKFELQRAYLTSGQEHRLDIGRRTYRLRVK